MLKSKNSKSSKTNSTCKFCGLDEATELRLKDIARFLEHSEIDVIKILIDQYYKMQTIQRRDEEGYLTMEFIPFYETLESYEQLKRDYEEEDELEYPAIKIDRHNYNEYIPPGL